MSLVIVTGPAAEPLALAEVKAHLRVTGTEEDALINALIATARGYAESYTNRALVARELDWVRDKFCAKLIVPVSPVRSVTSIKYLDASGAEQSLTTSAYAVDAESAPARIVEAYGQTWPTTLDTVNAVTVRLKAGYAIPFTAIAESDVLTAKGHSYSNGDIVRVSNTGGALPAGLAALTDYHVVNATADTLQLSSTAGGSAINITDIGSGTNFLGEIPREIQHAMLLLIAELYERRESAIVGSIINEVPFSTSALLSPYRMLRF
jgi:uncharacterized phiE125 gp8 family phage protein